MLFPDYSNRKRCKYHRRVPGTVIYTRPGERLKIHVLNADTSPHSLHAHGLVYCIDSDGSWPLGTQSHDGRRSDEICPGQTWTYTSDVTDKNIGAWPFHDHCHDIGANINRGLFGGIIVLPREEKHAPPKFHLPPEVEELLRELLEFEPPIGPIPMNDEPEEDPDHETEATPPETKRQREEHRQEKARFDLLHLTPISFEEYLHLPDVHPKPKPTDTLHVPLFLHYMGGSGGTPAFDSGPLALNATFETVFGAASVFNYHCQIHPGIGIARVGNSPNRYFIGPEAPGVNKPPRGGNKSPRRAAGRREFASGDFFRAVRQVVISKILSVACESRPEFHLAVSPNNGALKPCPAKVFCFNIR